MKTVLIIIITFLVVSKSFGQSPSVTLQGVPDTLCQNYYFLPSATVSLCNISGSANTYSWSFPGGTPSSSNSSNPPPIYYYVDGKHTVELTVTNACGSTTVNSILVIQTVPVPNVIADIIICGGDQSPGIPFSSVTPGARFYWTNSNIDIGLEANGGTNGGINELHKFLSNNIDAVSTIKLTSYITTSCPGSSTNFNITISVRPAAPASTDVIYCQNASASPLTATATEPNVLFWYTVATGGVSSISAPIPSTATPGVVYYYVSQGKSNSNCDGPRTQIKVTTIAAAIITGTVNNTTSCMSSTGSIVITGLTPNITYKLSYIKNTISSTQNLTSDATGKIQSNNLSAGTYSNITVILNGCTTANSIGPLVISDPVPPDTPTITSNSPVCSGDNINFIASVIANSTGSISYSWTGPNLFSSNNQNPTILNANLVETGTYFVIATQNNCASSAGSVNVVVNETPSMPIISSNSPICSGNNINLSGPSGGAAYSWSGPAFSSPNTSQSPSIANASLIMAGDYKLIIYSATGNCPSPQASTIVVVNITPVITSSSVTKTTTCGSSTGSIILNGLIANTSYQVSYTYNTTSTTILLNSAANGTITIPGLAAGTYTNIYVTLLACNSSAIATLTIANPATPAIPTITGTLTICSGNSLSLLANTAPAAGGGAVTYSWIAPSGTLNNNATLAIASSTISDAGAYTVRATQNGCVTAAASVTVTVNQTPSTPVISSNSPVCNGNTLQMTGSSSTGTYSWTGPGFSSPNTTQSPAITNASLSDGGSYSLIITNTGCSSTPANTNVIVNTTPNISTISSNSAICSGSTLNFSSTTDFTGSKSFAWSGPNNFTSILQNPSIINAPAAASGNYILTIKSTIGNCFSAATSTTAIINPTPLISSAIGTAQTDCFSANGFISLSGFTANTIYQIQYIKNANPVTIINLTSSSEGVIIIPNLSAATFSNISATLGSCISNTIAQVILAVPVPATPIASSNAPICDKVNNLNLFASTTTAGVFNYSWTGPGLYTSSQQNPVIANASQAAAGTYNVIVSYNNCVSASASTNVIIHSTPDAPIISSNSPICNTTTLNLKFSTSFVGKLNYSWQGPNSFTSTTASPIINNTSISAAGYYKLRITSVTGNCSSTMSQTMVVINPTPIISSIGIINPINCKSSTGSIQLKGLIAGTVYQTSYNTSSGVFITAPITADVAGTVVITNLTAQTYTMVQVTLAGCSTPGLPITLTDPSIPAAPSPSIGGTSCIGGNLQLLATTSTGISTYKWSFPNGEVNTNQNPLIINANATNNGNYLVTVTQNNCESATGTLQVTMHQPPTVPGVSDVVLCINSSAKLLTAISGAGNTLNWYNNASGGIGSLTSFIPSTLVAGDKNYYVSQMDNYGCASNRSTLLVTINPDAIAEFNPPVLAKCGIFIVGNSDIGLKQYPNNNSEYKWNVNNLYIGSGTIFPGYTIAENSNATIVLNAVSKFGCKDNNSTHTLSSISPTSSFTASSNQNCGSFSVQFTNTSITNAGFTYHWDFGNGKTFDGVAPGIINFLEAPVSGTDINYKVVLTVNSICGSISSTQYVLVKSVPKVKFSISNIISCTNQKVIFINESSGATSYNWVFGDGATRTILTTETVQYTYTGNTKATYITKLIATSANGCTGTTVGNINVYPTPVVAVVANTVNCINSLVNFSGSVQSTDPIKSSKWDISNGVSLPGTSMSYIFKTPGNYVVKYIATTINGCADTVYHPIQIKPAPVMNGGPDAVLCKGNSVVLNATSNTLFEWTPSLGLSCTNCAAPIASPITTTTYVLQGILNGCIATDTVIVTVAQPIKLLKSGGDTICIGQSVKFNITGAAKYKWTPVTGLSNAAIASPVANPIANTAYTVVGYDAYNCFTDTAFRKVTVGLLPIIGLGPDKVLATGTKYQLLSSVIINDPIISWQWTPAKYLDCATCHIAVASIKENISYILKATTNYGCIGADTINIKAFCENTQVFIPNAFTPDGDGVNDVLMIRATGIGIVKHFRIYNKWGKVVFEKNNFSPNDPKIGWDGRINGEMGFAEVYVYTAEVMCENGVSFIYKGNTTLIK